MSRPADELSENRFLDNLIVFGRLLRSLGIAVSPEQMADLALVFERTGIERRDDVYYAARSVLVRRRDDLPVFDQAFQLFFHIQGNPQQPVVSPTQAPARKIVRPSFPKQIVERQAQVPEAGKNPQGAEPPVGEHTMTYSAVEVLRKKDLALFTSDEVRAARRLVDEMQWTIGERRTRRYKSSPSGPQTDMPRLLRANLKHGAELFELPRRSVRVKPRPLVILADISGSMERYTHVLLHLLHAMYHSTSIRKGGQLGVFVFGTRLSYISPGLKYRSVDQALSRVAQHVSDWSGGTRIGEALKTFNFQWARRVLRSGAVVLVISDGWDCGDLDLLATEMARLQRSCSRLIWLNPLMGQPAFEAAALGLQTALPFVDDFLPVHNLDSVETLVRHLESLDRTRPLRRQRPRSNVDKPQSAPAPQSMEPPQMGTSNYVRRTIVLRTTENGTAIDYGENRGSERK